MSNLLSKQREPGDTRLLLAGLGGPASSTLDMGSVFRFGATQGSAAPTGKLKQLMVEKLI